MKKYFLVLLLFFMSIILIFSCRKSFEPQPNPDQKINPANETEMKIQSFLNGMNNNLKSGSTYTIEDAIWYAVATLNYSYAIYDSSFIYSSIETSSFSINLNPNNTVNQSDLQAAYGKMVDSLEAHYDGIQDSPKHVFLCEVRNVSNSVGTLDLVMVSVIGCGFTQNQYGSFGQTDYWFSVLDSGKCDSYHGQGVGEDASDRLEQKIMNPMILPVQDWRVYAIPGSEDFFEDVDPTDYPYGSAPRDFRGFYVNVESESWPGPQCLDPDEMNFYISANGIDFIIDDLQPQGKEFISIDVKDRLYLQEEYYEELHLFDITYGNLFRTQNSTIPF
jgi:hypothetical protein